MIVVIDVSQKQKESAYVLGGKRREADASGSLLTVLQEILQENNIQPRELEGIVVVLGQGRFTSSRTAVILANCFAYVHGVPVASCGSDEIGNEDMVQQKLKQNKTKYLFPTYYAEPNITQKNNI